MAHFAWPAWGIRWRNAREFTRLVRQSEEAYSAEWDGTTEASHEDIAVAAKAAGLSDANQCLNQKVALVARALFHGTRDREMRLLDLGAGAGATTLAIWELLGPAERQRTRWTLLDPARRALTEAGAAVRRAGLPMDQLELVVATDCGALPRWAQRFNIVVATAAVHHHGFLGGVFNRIAASLKPGGSLVIGDWFNGLSLHPGNVVELLRGLEWPEKVVALGAFCRRFPASREGPHRARSMLDRRADEQIELFWKAYASIEKASPGGFFVLEGHRRARHYVAELRQAGLCVPRQLPAGQGTNPYFIWPDSSLLGVFLAVKP